MSEDTRKDTCDGCVHKPDLGREYYDDTCFDCSRFYADKYTKIDDGAKMQVDGHIKRV